MPSIAIGPRFFLRGQYRCMFVVLLIISSDSPSAWQPLLLSLHASSVRRFCSSAATKHLLSLIFHYVGIFGDGSPLRWRRQHCGWLGVRVQRDVLHSAGHNITGLRFSSGDGPVGTWRREASAAQTCRTALAGSQESSAVGSTTPGPCYRTLLSLSACWRGLGRSY